MSIFFSKVMEATVLLQKLNVSSNQQPSCSYSYCPNFQALHSLSFLSNDVIIATPLPSESAQVNRTVLTEQVSTAVIARED